MEHPCPFHTRTLLAQALSLRFNCVGGEGCVNLSVSA
jgi:hypothetical protein